MSDLEAKAVDPVPEHLHGDDPVPPVFEVAPEDYDRIVQWHTVPPKQTRTMAAAAERHRLRAERLTGGR